MPSLMSVLVLTQDVSFYIFLMWLVWSALFAIFLVSRSTSSNIRAFHWYNFWKKVTLGIYIFETFKQLKHNQSFIQRNIYTSSTNLEINQNHSGRILKKNIWNVRMRTLQFVQLWAFPFSWCKCCYPVWSRAWQIVKVLPTIYDETKSNIFHFWVSYSNQQPQVAVCFCWQSLTVQSE